MKRGWTKKIFPLLGLGIVLVLLLAVALMAVLGPGLVNVVFVLSVMGWVGYDRLARGQA